MSTQGAEHLSFGPRLRVLARLIGHKTHVVPPALLGGALDWPAMTAGTDLEHHTLAGTTHTRVHWLFQHRVDSTGLCRTRAGCRIRGRTQIRGKGGTVFMPGYVISCN